MMLYIDRCVCVYGDVDIGLEKGGRKGGEGEKERGGEWVWMKMGVWLEMEMERAILLRSG